MWLLEGMLNSYTRTKAVAASQRRLEIERENEWRERAAAHSQGGWVQCRKAGEFGIIIGWKQDNVSKAGITAIRALSRPPRTDKAILYSIPVRSGDTSLPEAAIFIVT